MKRLLLLLALSLFLATPDRAQAQDQPPQPSSKHSVFLELGGNGGLYTVNYEHRFTDHLGGRAGFMIVEGQSDQPTDDRVGVAIIPVMANYLAGSGSHRLELGGGVLFGVVGGDLEEYGRFAAGGLAGVTSTIGYRYQPVDGGFQFRIGLTPFYSAGRPQLWGGLSLGYSF